MNFFVFLGGVIFFRIGAERLAANSPELDYVIIAVNGQETQVRGSERYVLIEGDTLELKKSYLKDGSTDHKLNFVGYVPAGKVGKDNTAHDLGYEIDTGKHLLKDWAKNKDRMIYEVTAQSSSGKNGFIEIQVIPAELKYAELLIDGESKIIRDGETIKIADDSQFKVKSVVTNVENDRQEVYYEIVEKKLGPKTRYELVLKRKNLTFATLGIQVKGGTRL